MPSRRQILKAGLTGAALVAAPAIIPRSSLGQGLKKVKIASAVTTTTNAAFLMPGYLKEHGIEAEVVLFPSLVQRMQAVASGDIDVGNGGLSATMQLSVKGFPMVVLANGCDGGWGMLGKPGIKSLAELKGKKVAVQNGSIGLASLAWKLKQEKLDGVVELVFMDNQLMPTPLAQGDVDAILCFEPYLSIARLNKFGTDIWNAYETPMAKTNLGFVASSKFVAANPDLTKLMVEAHVKATKELIAKPEIALETTMKQFNLSKEVAVESNKNLFFSVDSGPAFVEGLHNLAKMMIDAKMLDVEPKWDEFVNTKYL